MNSSSSCMASGSPLAASNDWAAKRSRWITGSASSEYAVASSIPRTYRSHFSVSPGFERWGRVRGDVSSGKSRTKVGSHSFEPTSSSKISSAIFPATQ